MQNGQSSDWNEKALEMNFGKLSADDQDLLYKAPALVSVLAASTYNRINQDQKVEALKLAHLKTFTARAELTSFYRVVEANFKKDFEDLEKQFYPFDKPNREALKSEIEKVNVIIGKLDKQIAAVLHKSLNEYAMHIKKSGIGILDDFVFPLPIKGLTY
jgi:hypothetical protein